MMKFLRYILGLVLVLVQFYSLIAQAISKEMQETVTYETKANAVAARSDEKILIEHYEIPLEFLESDVAERAPKEFVDSLIFEKNGQKYVRWIINPEDTKWHLSVKRLLKTYRLSAERHQYFEGYQTASRSYIIVDPKSGAEFSAKVSTDKTGGAWRDKKQTWDDAKQIRTITDYVNDQIKKQGKLGNAILLDEPIAFGIKALDQGMVIRSYESLTNSGMRYVPGFSIVHDETGRKLAEKNGSMDPAFYWNKNYNQPLARALAEFAALTGMSYDSPHSQNFMVELDAKFKPTGRIVLRDFGDTYLYSEYFKATGREDILKIWEPSNVKEKYMKSTVGILHGNKPPKWLNRLAPSTQSDSYERWGVDFFKAYEREFRNQTKFILSKGEWYRSEIVNEVTKASRPGDYFSRVYQLDDAIGADFLKAVAKGQQRIGMMARYCSQVFAN